MNSSQISKVIVSTDSEEIKAISIDYGAECRFLRPKDLSTDEVPLEPVLIHALNWLKSNENYVPDSVTLVPATNPLRKPEHLDDCISKFYETNSDNVMTVHESPANYSPYWSIELDDKDNAKFFGNIDLHDGPTQRQSFPKKIYSRNDIAYTFKPANLYSNKPSIYGKKNQIVEMSKQFDGDINSPEDWKVTEILFDHLYG